MPRVPSLALSSLLAHLASPRPSPVVLQDLPPLPALNEWFDKQGKLNLAHFAGLPQDPLVPLEHTSPSSASFSRLQVPFSYYLSYLSSPPPSATPTSTTPDTLYLAQFVPPPSISASLPPPQPIADKLSHSSIWLGLTPTTTPLHRDPEDNVLYQLAGGKKVRLLPPKEGEGVLAKVREVRGLSKGMGKMRGEEMMRPGEGGERDALEEAVWGSAEGREGTGEGLKRVAWEATLGRGDALFIPRGWWHAVRGRKEGDEAEQVNASVNWWFR